MTTTKPSLKLPRLRQDQWEIVKHPARVKWICMGRRWGKTLTSGAVALATARSGGQVGWAAPTYKNTRPLWKMLERSTAGLKKLGMVSLNKSEQLCEFKASGGSVAIYSLDNPESVLGNDFDLVIIDEAARVRDLERVWFEIVQPTLADRDGSALLISTPVGLNFFYTAWLAASQDATGYSAAFRAPTSDNPIPAIQEAFTRARQTVPDKKFRAQWLAEFIEDGDGVFAGVRDCIRDVGQTQRESHAEAFVFGVDWGRTHDYTAIAVLEVNRRELVHVERFTGIDFERQISRIAHLVKRFAPDALVCETNNMGRDRVDYMRNAGFKVVEFTTTVATKNSAVDDLALAFQNGDIAILDDDVLVNELLAYTGTQMASGLWRYSAPSGLHDDTVVATMLAWHGGKSDDTHPGYRIQTSWQSPSERRRDWRRMNGFV